MKIKRFIGNTTQEAMYRLKKELGPDAIILHTRKIKQSGLLGLFKKNLVEVVAAIEENNTQERYGFEERVNSTNNEHGYNSNRAIPPMKMKDELEIEIKKIRNMVESVVNTLDNKKVTLPEELRPYLENLILNGVKEEVAFEILSKINDQINISLQDSGKIREIVLYSIKEYLGEPSPIIFDGKQKVIFFVGPTGVGKTTTLAKIAANLSLECNCSVGMVTADTYRIAAVEQLKIYAEIMNIPIKVIYEIEEIYKSLSNFKDKNIILVDTAGRNHKNKDQMNEIRELIQSVNNKEVYLVINSTTDMKTIENILRRYDFVNDFRIIFSKVDEAENLGNILNTKFYFKKDISYLTTGQDVPDDIEIPDMENISRVLIGEQNNE